MLKGEPCAQVDKPAPECGASKEEEEEEEEEVKLESWLRLADMKRAAAGSGVFAGPCGHRPDFVMVGSWCVPALPSAPHSAKGFCTWSLRYPWCIGSEGWRYAEVKRLKLPPQGSMQKELANEIDALIALDHPAIVRLIECAKGVQRKVSASRLQGQT